MIEVLRDGKTLKCASVAGKLNKAETRSISCKQGAIGNIVMVRLPSKKRQMLTLCEVEVYGTRGKTKSSVLNCDLDYAWK